MDQTLHKRRAVSLLSGPAVALLLAAAPASAQIPVNPADGCGQTLSAPGKYVLTGDLACPGGVSGIIIEASNVVFHLAGHTISSADCDLAQTVAGVFVNGGLTGVFIDGGTITGFKLGSSCLHRIPACAA